MARILIKKILDKGGELTYIGKESTGVGKRRFTLWPLKTFDFNIVIYINLQSNQQGGLQ